MTDGTALVEIGGIAQITAQGIPQARPITVLTVNPEDFRHAAAAALSDSSARGQAVPPNWPAPRSTCSASGAARTWASGCRSAATSAR